MKCVTVVFFMIFMLHGAIGDDNEIPEEIPVCDCSTTFNEECNCATTSNELVQITHDNITSPLLDVVAKTGFFKQPIKSITCLNPNNPCMKSLYTDANNSKGGCTPIRTEIRVRIYDSDLAEVSKMTVLSIYVDVGCRCNAVSR